MIRYLSHKLANFVPAYGAFNKKIDLRKIKSISRGDSCVVVEFSMENHIGTHVDCPAHFLDQGKSPIDYDADFWIFRRPQVIPVKAAPGKIIGINDLPDKVMPYADILLFNSGWGKLRGQDVYSMNNPGISPELGRFIRRNFTSVRAIGIDWVSLSSYANRWLGRQAHRAFLDPKEEGHPLLIIEDMSLPDNLKNLIEIWAAPLLLEGLDSAPCTVIGFFND